MCMKSFNQYVMTCIINNLWRYLGKYYTKPTLCSCTISKVRVIQPMHLSKFQCENSCESVKSSIAENHRHTDGWHNRSRFPNLHSSSYMKILFPPKINIKSNRCDYIACRNSSNVNTKEYCKFRK